jgi:uncharacterized membrane protein YozB (DUF420 family)
MLTIGWRLAVGHRYEAHRWVQTAAVCLNALLVIVWMIRSFWVNVRPGFPSDLGHGPYLLAIVHIVVGVIGFVLGVFLVLRGNEIVRSGLTRDRFKPAMRVSYTVYMLGTLLGVVLYVVTYR